MVSLFSTQSTEVFRINLKEPVPWKTSRTAGAAGGDGKCFAVLETGFSE
jgi:hypothetical protein